VPVWRLTTPPRLSWVRCKHPVMLRSLEAFFPWALNVSATATIKAATSYINLLRLESPGGIALLFRQSPIIRANSASQCFRKSCSPGHGFSLRQQRSRLALRSTPMGQKGSWTGSLRRAVRSPDLAFADSAKGRTWLVLVWVFALGPGGLSSPETPNATWKIELH
jgi:hypothetical protein